MSDTEKDLNDFREIRERKEMLLKLMVKSQREIRIMRISTVIMLSLSIIAALWNILNVDNQKYFRKDEIKNNLYQLIKNGSDIESVKHVYSNRVCVSDFKTLFLSNETKTREYYKYDIGLNIILKDLLADYYLNKDSICDSLLCNNLMTIMKQYETKNPFDNLEENIKYYFVNIQTKLKYDKYTDIHSDVMKIADELRYKNGLINKYLNYSELSLYISVAALLITIFLSLYQIIQSNSSNKKINAYLSSIVKEK